MWDSSQTRDQTMPPALQADSLLPEPPGKPMNTSCEMPGWMKHKLESRLPGEISITSDMQWRGTKEPLDKSERGEWKSWLKTQHSKNEDHGIWSHHLWEIEREKEETVTDFIFLGSKITVDNNWNHELRRHLLLGRKAMINLDSVLKSRDNTLLTEVHLVKVVAFPVVMYGCESWTIKKAERQRTNTFELWC